MEPCFKDTGNFGRPKKRPRTEQVRVVPNTSISHQSPITCVDYHPDGTYLATSTKDASHVYDVRTAHRFRQLPTHGCGYARSLRFSTDGTCLITGFETPLTTVHDIATGLVKFCLPGHSAAVYSIEVCPKNGFIATASADGNTILWRENTGTLLASLADHSDGKFGVTSVSVSRTGDLVATASLDSVVRFWDAHLGVLVGKFSPHSDVVYSIAFSKDGKSLLSASLDKTLKMWDLAKPSSPGHCVQSFEGHRGGVLSTAFSPNGSCLFSASMDRCVRMWDLRLSKSIFTLQQFGGSVMSVAHSPIGHYFSTGCGDSTARTWSYLP